MCCISCFCVWQYLCFGLCSSVHLCTASLHGRGTYTCPCWTGCMSTIPPSTPAGSCCVKTTAPMRQSSSRCELFRIAFPEERDLENHSHTRLCEENYTQPEYETFVSFFFPPTLWCLSVTCTNLNTFCYISLTVLQVRCFCGVIADKTWQRN